jgi:hypothetical protein
LLELGVRLAVSAVMWKGRRSGSATASATWVRGVCSHLRLLRPEMTPEECLRLITRLAPSPTLTPEQAARMLAEMLPEKK